MVSDGSSAPASRLIAGVATAAAVVLVAGVAVSARGADPADEATTVSAGAVVRTASGTHVSRDGETVPRGAQVSTSREGTRLRTDGRTVVLGQGTAVTVLDGVHQRVARGSVLVQVGEGPGLTVSSAGGTVRVPDRKSVARLDTGSVVRATSYAGVATFSVPGRGTTTRLKGLYTVEFALGSAPGPAAPLHLHAHDGWEPVYLPEVVAADGELTGLAEDSAEAGSPFPAALPASLRVPDAVVTAEHVVAYALAAGRDDTYADALSLRGEGGSWGVVAELVDAPGDAGAAFVDALGSGQDTTQVLAAADPGSTAVLPVLDPVRASASPAARPSPTTAAPRPRTRPSTAPAPSPSPSAGVVPQPVATLLAPVLDLLPVEVPLLPRPSPTASRKPQVPVVGPLVDGLVTPSR